VHLVGFIIRKFVIMHGHMNIKWVLMFVTVLSVPINREYEDPTIYTVLTHT
jgi:hypothetical protein